MAILEGDVKLLKSQVMDDVDEGGGRATGIVIVDGASNSIFNDISELDRAYGSVDLRKVFVKVDTPNTDGYFGAHVVVSEPPVDTKVSCTLFTTQNNFDTRNAASSRVESYLAQGSLYAGFLFGDHITGQQTISILQHEDYPLPVNSDTFVLRKNEGSDNMVEQYVRVTDVSSRLRTFEDLAGYYKRVEVTLTISDPLQTDFPGFSAYRLSVSIDYLGKTKFYNTIVADAARYYGATPLSLAAIAGDVVVQGKSIFTQIVPSTRVEIPVTDSRMNQQSVALVKAGSPLTQTVSLAFGSSQAMFIGGGILPNTLTITRSGISITDKGGVLLSNGTQVGTVDYENGVCSLVTNVFGTGAGAHSVTYTPAAVTTLVTSSIGIPVTKPNQRLNWVVTIDPTPTKKSLQVSYRALGRWYVLTEDGSGALRGSDSNFGAGTLNYQTGSVSVTLGALPDVGSQIIFSYSPSIVVRPITETPKENFTDLDRFACVVNTGQALAQNATFTWNDGVARTATISNRSIIGDASGECNCDTGIVRFSPNILPPKNTNITLTSAIATNVKSTIDFDASGLYLTATVGATVAGSFQMAICLSVAVNEFPNIFRLVPMWARIVDDKLGNLKLNSPNGPSYTVGVINYTTGLISINKTVNYTFEEPLFALKEQDAGSAPGAVLVKISTWVPDGFIVSTKACLVLESTVGAPAIPRWGWGWSLTGSSAYISRNTEESGSSPIVFSFGEIFYPQQLEGVSLGSKRYVWNSSGNRYNSDIDPTNGGGTSSGYRTVLANQVGMILTYWVAGSSSLPTDIVGSSGVDITGVSGLIVTESVTFRTAISPLFNGGFTISGTWTDGVTFTAYPNSDGIIKTASNTVRGLVGRVNYETGIATIKFGKLGGTLGDGSTQDMSYLGIDGVANMTSDGVRADSLRYSAVGYSYIPLDADVLGLDPVRLPNDGRVPIFRKGGLALVHHTKKSTAMTVSSGQTVNLARVRLARIRVVGNNGATITTGYTVDLDAGTVTFADVSGYSQPIRIEDRIEDLGLIRDAQIDGTITLTRQLTHNFPLGSFVSSALIIGDMKARVSTLFDQATWAGNLWEDSVIGSPATASYNDVLAPIAVSNSGAITERWVARFTNTNAFEIIGEHVGVIATGNTSTDCAPMNPAASSPYFTMPAIGWGGGWSVGNIVRFNTVGALFPMWIIRTIQQGLPTSQNDSFTILTLGDIDRV